MSLLEALIAAKLSGSGGGGGSGIPDNVKQALLNCFNHVAAWTDEHGQDYVDALEAALYPLDRITAEYTQSGTVYDTDSLDSLKTDLVVTAFYQGGGSKTVTDYTMSGTLTEGTSTIIVSYGGKSTAFTVVVTKREYVIDVDNTGFRIAQLNRDHGDTVYPYYFDNATNSSKRYSYAAFDLRLEGGKKYKFTAECNYATAQMGLQFYNQTVLNAVSVQGSFNMINVYDPGWQSLTAEIDVPANQNNSPIVGVRVTFRQNTNNTNISNDFAISRLTAKEVTA